MSRLKHKVICGHVLDVLKTMPDESVDTIVTSPPYWRLRSYLPDNHPDKDKEIGQESTLDEYISHLLEVTWELKRILKKTGVMFWNHDTNKQNLCDSMQNYRLVIRMIDEQGWLMPNKGPIIWFKPNHMPDSFKRGFTHSYEPVFMLVKDRNYWFDLDAVRVPHKESSKKRVLRAVSNKHKYLGHPEYSGGGGINKPRPNRRKLSINFSDLFDEANKEYHREQNMAISQYQYAEGDYLVVNLHPLGANPGDVWSISNQSFSDAHFAVFGERFVEPLIKVACPQWICKKCGKPRERIVAKKYIRFERQTQKKYLQMVRYSPTSILMTRSLPLTYTKDWTDCGCGVGWEAGVVLDPFAGSGTVGVVAERLGRNSILIDLNKEYCEMAYRRLKPLVRQMKLDREPSIIERIGF